MVCASRLHCDVVRARFCVPSSNLECRMGGRLVLVVAALIGFVSPVSAQQLQRTHDITLEDYFTQADLFQIAMSSSGEVAYTEGRWQQSTDDRKTDLWVVDSETKRGKRLTSDRAGYRAPQWSSSGQTIYVLANRKREGEKQPPYNGKSQVWKITRDPMRPD